MIIKSSQRAGAKNLAHHLVSDENESVRVVGTQGIIASSSIQHALAEMQAIAYASRCSKHLYHVSISPAPDHEMTELQWRRAWELHDQIQGTDNLAYLEVEHRKNVRTHRHRVYERVDYESGKALNLSWTRIKNERIARQLEHEFGHKLIQGRHNRSVSRILKKEGLTSIAVHLDNAGLKKPAIPDFTHQEWQQNNTNKIKLMRVRKQLSDAWTESNTTGELEKAVTKRGYVLARGNKAIMVTGPDLTKYPLLRSINVIRKRNNEKTVRKSELEARLPSVLPMFYESCEQYDKLIHSKIKTLTNNHKKRPKTTKENTKNGPVIPSSYKNSLESRPITKDYWIRYRETLLRSQYTNLDLDSITPYWLIYQYRDGSLKFTNRSGSIHDLGDKITSNTCNTVQSAKIMTQLCIAKGWIDVRAIGDDDFKLASYKELIRNDISCIIENRHDEIIWLQANREVNACRNRLSLSL